MPDSFSFSRSEGRNITLSKKLSFTLLALLFMGGNLLAASKEMIRLQSDVSMVLDMMRDLQKSHDTQSAILKTLVEQIADQVAQLRRSIDEIKSSNQQTQAAVASKVETINNQIGTVNSGLDLILDKISKLSSQLAEIKAKQEVEVLKDTQSSTPGAAPGRPAAPPSPDQLYNSSYSDYMKGNYDLAIQGFEEYLRIYPDTELSDNAAYWIGECHYVRRKFPEAIVAFDKVISTYPDGDKAPAAMLKKGYSLLETKQTQEGIRELRGVMQKYPGSDAAQLAKDRLTAMGVSTAIPRATPAKKSTRR
jgi:tol-pal system protein YbgF